MIPSAKSPWLSRWFAGQALGRMRGSFDALYLEGRGTLAAALAEGPVLVVSNHTSWWDPLVLLVLLHRFVPADAFAMMDADNLRRLPFFAKVGAFGVERGSRRDGVEAIDYAASLLTRPGRAVWVFAQGRERPVHERPLRFAGGAARIAQRAPHARVLPVGLAYAFGATPRPSVYVSIGDPLPAAPEVGHARASQARAVEARLARIERAQGEQASRAVPSTFEAHRLSSPRWWATLPERMLATLTRPFVPGLGSARLESAVRSEP